jgi:hypothetical protein
MSTIAFRSARSTAVSVGGLYLAATLSGGLAAAVMAPLGSLSGTIVDLADSPSRVWLAVVFMLIMAVSVAAIACMLTPVLWRDGRTPGWQGLALCYLGSRLIEDALFLVGILGLLSLLGLSQALTDSPALALPVGSALNTLYASSFALGQVVFCLGAAILYILLFVTRRVPRWLSLWGLIAAPLMLIASLLPLIHGDPGSTELSVLHIPMALQEMVLAVWLIARGFAAPQPQASR